MSGSCELVKCQARCSFSLINSQHNKGIIGHDCFAVFDFNPFSPMFARQKNTKQITRMHKKETLTNDVTFEGGGCVCVHKMG
jgi:hypothetical protein